MARTFLVLFLLAACALPAQAQRVTVRTVTPPGVDSTLVARFQLADTYIRGGQYDRAIGLLEDLYADNPSTYAFYDKLKEAYENVKRYDDALALVDDWMARNTGDPTAFIAEKARLTYLQGDEQAAFDLWDSAIPRSEPNENVYRAIYSSMLNVRLFDKAIDVLEQGRRDVGQITLYQADLAYLYSLTSQHEQAMEEYLALLAVNERQLNYVRNRLNRFLEQEGALEASIAATERGVRKHPLNRSYREILGWLYMEDQNYEKAFDAFRAIDRLEKEDGQVLFGFAQRAAGAGAYDVALEAFQEVLDRYPNAPSAAEAQLGIAEMHEQWAAQSRERIFDDKGNRQAAPHYDAALDAYRVFLQKYPTHPYFPDVLRRVGHMQQDVFFALNEASATLQEVAERYPQTQAAFQARFDLGRIAMMRGNLEEARLIYARLVEELRIGELAEQARYEQALIHFYRGEFDVAKTLASALDENTSTDVANDAIELKVLLIENKGPDSLNTALKNYAAIALQQRQRRTDEALQSLNAFLEEYGQHPLADDARFLRATVLHDAGRIEDALAAFGELPLMYPTSYLADRSLFEAASIQEHDLGDTEAALKTYTRLLTEYPGSLLVPDARQRIRILRDDVNS